MPRKYFQLFVYNFFRYCSILAKYCSCWIVLWSQLGFARYKKMPNFCKTEALFIFWSFFWNFQDKNVTPYAMCNLWVQFWPLLQQVWFWFTMEKLVVAIMELLVGLSNLHKVNWRKTGKNIFYIPRGGLIFLLYQKLFQRFDFVHFWP